jgi:hypothetical protein
VPAIGEQSPPQATLGHVIDAAKIAKHLRRRHPVLALATRFLAIKHPIPALCLNYAHTVLEALPRSERCSFGLRVGIAEEEGVRHVVTRLDRKVLLDRDVGPADRFEQWPDEFLLRLRLCWVLKLAESR